MEDNERNQMLALQVLNMVSQGCCIQPAEMAVPIGVAYAEMWLDRDMFFFCEINGGETGKQHVIRFDHFEPLSNQVLFFDKEGKLIAGLAPYIEWPEVDAVQMQSVWAEWQKNTYALEGCKEAAQEWRHAQLGGE